MGLAISLLIKAIKYVGALYLPGRHLFKVSRCPQHTVFSISLTELPFKINILKAGGAKIEDIVKTTIFLTDLSNFEIVNRIYSDFFNVENPPARACVEVSSLPKGVLVEIDCVAFLD